MLYDYYHQSARMDGHVTDAAVLRTIRAYVRRSIFGWPNGQTTTSFEGL